jgi:alpha-1,6-mannosyltransferase
MKICDLVRAYTPTGGNTDIYLSEKRQYIERHPHHHHILIIPGEEDRVIREGNRSTFVVASPLIRGCEPYRFLRLARKVMAILLAEQPEVIELEDAYISPWVAFRYRRRHPCSVVGFCHRDFPGQQVKPALSRLLGNFFAKTAKKLAERYVCWIYSQCNLTITASRALQTKLQDLGVQRVTYIPLSVDLDLAERETAFDDLFNLYEYLRLNNNNARSAYNNSLIFS